MIKGLFRSHNKGLHHKYKKPAVYPCYTLIQPIDLFLKSADSLFGPITTICRNGRVKKKIPWSAFTLMERDWERVADVRDILKVIVPYCR
jgi:hypothetical protein